MTEKKKVTLQDQLKNKANFMDNEKLYLVRCLACNRENWAPAVASGNCAWCGWNDEKSNGVKDEKQDKQ